MARSSGGRPGRRLVGCGPTHRKNAPFLFSTATGTRPVRFARWLGYPGFPLLQAELKARVLQKLTTVERLQEPGRLPDARGVGALAATARQESDNVLRLLRLNRPQVVRACVAMLRSSETVRIVGMQSSASLAHFFGFHLGKARSGVSWLEMVIYTTQEQEVTMNMRTNLTWSRRQLLTTGAAAVASAFTMGRGRAASAQGKTSVAGERELYILSWGGPLSAVQRKVHIPEFEKKYDCKVSITEGQSMSATIAAQKDDPQFDVFMDSILFIPRYKDAGIYSKLTESEVPRLKDLHPKYRQFGQDLVIPLYVQAMTIAYNEKQVKRPTSLDDLLKPEYKGKVAFQKPPDAVLFMPMIMAHTGATFENPDPAFKWLEKVMPNVLTHYAAVTQMAQLLEREEVWIGVYYSGRVVEMRSRGLPVNYFNPPSGAIPIINGPAVTLKAKHPKLARAWVNHVLDPEMQVELSKATFFGPTNRNVKLSPELSQAVIDEPQEIQGLLDVDWAKLMALQDEWTQRYNKIMAVAR